MLAVVTNPPTTSTVRVRRHRARDKAKKRSLRVVFTKRYLDQLVSDGRIKAEELDDPEEFGAVIEEDYYCQKHGTFRPGPIVVTGTSTS